MARDGIQSRSSAIDARISPCKSAATQLLIGGFESGKSCIVVNSVSSCAVTTEVQ